MRRQWLAAAGLLLALALAIAGELLFDSTSSLALSLKPAGGLALAASLAAAILTAWLAPARSDAPGLSRPLPPPPPPIRPSLTSPGSGHHPAERPNAPVGQDRQSTRAASRGSRGCVRWGSAWRSRSLPSLSSCLRTSSLPQLTYGQRLTAGSLVTLAGMVLFGLSAVRPDPALSTFGRRMRGLLPVTPVLTNRWSLAWLAIGLGGYAFAMGRFEGGGESRAVVWAWLIGIAALLISQWPPVSRSTMTSSYRPSEFICWRWQDLWCWRWSCGCIA